jgi:aryl-alcohol dehydrogenase-like predicted oxidoreductase
MGSGEVGSSLDREKSFQFLDAMIDNGGNFIDTAHNYGDWVKDLERGASEKTIGAWMKERRCRSKVILATKGAHPILDGRDIPRAKRADIEKDLNESLEYLQVDYIDLYWLHRDDPSLPVEEMIDTLNDAVKAGKIRYFAASNWKVPRIEAANRYASEQGLQGFVADQCLWNAALLAKVPWDNPAHAWMDDGGRWDLHVYSGMAVVCFQSQAYGLYQHMHHGRLEQIHPVFRAFYKIPECLQRYERMRRIMVEMDLSITQVVLGYLLSQPFTTIPIVGCQKPEEVADSFSAGDVKLTPTQVWFIQAGYPA